MNREQFLSTLRHELRGILPQEREEIIADYEEYFRDARAAGRDEEEVARSLGSPRQLARELRAEARIKDWEAQRSPGNLLRMCLAVAGLGLINIMVLPLLLCLVLTVLVLFVAAFVLMVTGIGLLLAGMPGMGLGHLITVDVAGIEVTKPLHVAWVGFGVLGVGLVWALVNTWLSKWLARGLARYARLNYRLVRGQA
ncbi:DUF1700 domain-containing protein [Chitinimonas sp.]|uniref:DUF1700 domain-containing protein n=1 Tax=Chitinimonas sp. TaxID=1934313 RepID=UPI002F92C707